jgi:hypothetical protein
MIVDRMTDREEIRRITEEIYNITCPILDIGERSGITGYIDFIDTNEFSEAFNKGVDSFGRKFISFRTKIEYTNGETKETFMTLFQRYMGDEYLWMGAGKNLHLFATEGGTNLHQVNLVLKLLKESSVDVTEDIYKHCRLTQHTYSLLNPDNNIPKRIYLVSNEKPNEKLEDVMKDLEQKVNPKSAVEGLSQLEKAVQTKDPSILLAPMQKGAKEFEEKVGRPMTYGEMRAMWG